MGLDPQGLMTRVVDAIVGQRYFRAWLADSLDAMRAAAKELLATHASVGFGHPPAAVTRAGATDSVAPTFAPNRAERWR
jgi:hypothetical protein